ncbi:hypothetical protein QIA34_07190 (plasmid) [Borreliella yangtzensis]|uniref:Uncharacterized protein n=1 Tax=Borreliella yangtzensis TaxID=683292 RepID=A0ABR6PBU4_9SPIR|nr:hypothetical protein [Borreliella yangtzensis]
MKRVYIILYFLFALLSLNANEFLRSIYNDKNDDVNFEDFKMQENSLYLKVSDKKDENKKGYFFVAADKDVFNFLYIFGTAIGQAFSNTDETKAKDKKKAEKGLIEDINGFGFGGTSEKGSKIVLFFKKEILKNANNIKNMIISYSFDKEEPIISSIGKQWIVEDNSVLVLKDNEMSNFLKKALSSRVLKVKVYDKQKINESFSIRLRNFQDLYDMYEHNLN